MKFYVQVEDCQNNVEVIVAVEAKDEQEAKFKALRALHVDDNLYIVSKEDAEATIKEEGIIAIDERGDEINISED